MALQFRSICLILLALCAAWMATSVAAQPPADHVVLISIDGLRPEFYLDPGWPAPRIQQMAREGVHAERVRGVFPSVTYPSHTTMVTGAMPLRHGIYYNRPFEPGGQTGRWYWEEAVVEVPTLWDAVHDSGGKTAAWSWPVTVGAPIDWLVPEVWSLEEGSDRLAPMREETRPAGLWQEVEREATGHLNMNTFSSAYMSRDDKSAAAVSYILETYQPTLLAFHILSPDHFEHEDGRDSPRVRRAVSTADRAVSAVVDAADRAGILSRTAFIVTGDHGFVTTNVGVAPNVWLVEAGLMAATPDRGDWRATFHSSTGAAFLHLRDPGDAAAEAEVRTILAAQPWAVRKLFRVVEREELDEIGADPRVPLALAAGLGVALSSRGGGPAVGPADGGEHGYFPSDFPEIYTGFIGWGAGLRSGGVIHLMGLEDIAPLVAELLGLDFVAPDGTAPLGVLRTP